MFKKIDVTDIKGFKIGNAENLEAGTGCTVIISEEGAIAGVDVRGGNPATRDTEILKSERSQETINAVVLSGGSAFGLEAGSGVMRALETREIGPSMGNMHIPTVVQASLFDMGVGRADIRPDRAMGIKAVDNAYEGIFEHGNRGAGTGATVGKYYGMSRAMKAGLGTFACSDGTCEVGAITAVNAFADVYDGGNNIIAGLTSADNERIEGTIRCLKNAVTKNPKLTLTAEQSMLLRKRINTIKQQLEDKIAIKSEEFDEIIATKEDEAPVEPVQVIEQAPVIETVQEEAVPGQLEATEPAMAEEAPEESVVTEETPVEPVAEEAEVIAQTIEEPVIPEVAAVEPVLEEAPAPEPDVIEIPAATEIIDIPEEVAEEPAVEEPAEITETEAIAEVPDTEETPEANIPVEAPVTEEPAPVIETEEVTIAEVTPEEVTEEVIAEPEVDEHHIELINELKAQFENIEPEEPVVTTPSFLEDPNTLISVSDSAFDSEDDELNALLASIASNTSSKVEEPTVELTYEDMGYNLTFNTTIACLITNAKLTKSDCNRLATILHDGYARAIKPVHSTMDGDTIFVMTTNEVEVNFDAFAALATDIIQYSVIDGVLAAEDAYGLHSARYFRNK